MKDEIIYYCNTCKKEIKNPDLHNKRTNNKHDIRIKGTFVYSVESLKKNLYTKNLKINEDGSFIVQ